MGKILDPFTPLNFPNLFTMMWVGSLLIVVGSIVVYNLAQRRSRRYPTILALHEWVFWSIVITFGITPLLVVIHVPLLLLLLVLLPGIAIAAYATFVRFPPQIAAANDEIRRRRFVPPPRREVRERAKPTPAGRRRRHR
jgi:predicted membrane channel-forming protein YqfA (hemolysin III family)